MKPSVSPHMAALVLLGVLTPLSAQNLMSVPASMEADPTLASKHAATVRVYCSASLPTQYEVPEVKKAIGILPGDNSVYASQDVRTLDTRASDRQNVESVIDLDLLRQPSPYRKIVVSSTPQPYEIAPDSLQNGLAMILAVYRESGKPEAGSDCSKISLSIEQRVKLDVAKVLEVVETEVAANPGCSCEIVKSAIKASDADVALVVSIVETAITASPENMRMISQCAIASMPEAVAEVQALLAKLDPNRGDAEADSAKSSKDSKGAKVASIVSTEPPNPLDLPPYFPPIPPIVPPRVTNVNPSGADHCY